MKVNIDNGADYNERGVTPNIGMPAEDEADSSTKATVSEGEIEIRDKENQKQDIAGLNRDAQNALNKLGEIFDKNDVKEKQEFVGLAQELGHKMIGDLTGKISLEQKAMLNTFLEGLISQWANGDFSGAAGGAAAVEMAKQALWEIKDPAVRQWAAEILGAIVSKAAGGEADSGASSAVNTEKYNGLNHEEQEKLIYDLQHAETQEERFKIIQAAAIRSQWNREKNPAYGEAMEELLIDELEKICKYDKGIGINFIVDRNQGLNNTLIEAEAFFDLYNTFKTIGDVSYGIVKTGIDVTADVVVLSKVKVVRNIVFIGQTAYKVVNDSKRYGGIYDEDGNINEKTVKAMTADVVSAVFFDKAMDKYQEYVDDAFVVIKTGTAGSFVLEKAVDYYKDSLE